MVPAGGANGATAASAAAAAASQASSTGPNCVEPPNAETVPQSDSPVIVIGNKATRARLAVRARACDRPRAVSVASSPQTQDGVCMRTGPSIWGWWTSIWISMMFLL